MTGLTSLAREIETINQMPGGPELLYTEAARELGDPGSHQLRLFQMGGAVEGEGGGLNRYSEMIRAAGRGDDDVLLHVSPEEFEALKAMWGEPEMNPRTGLPEYGFLSKAWKKIKKAVKKVVKSPVFQAIAPIALNVALPGAGAALGSALGAGSATAGVVGDTLIRGALGAAGGGGRGAVMGALGSPELGGALGRAAGLTGRTAQIVGTGALGGLGSGATGGDFVSGAIGAGLDEYMRPSLERGLEGLLSNVPGAGRAGDVEVNRPAGSVPGAAALPQTPVTPSSAPTGAGGLGGNLAQSLPLLLAGAGALGSTGEYGVAPTPDYGAGFGEPLPVLDFDRQLTTPGNIDYYTYGQAGAAQPGEQSFFMGNVLPGDREDDPAISPIVGEDLFLTPAEEEERRAIQRRVYRGSQRPRFGRARGGLSRLQDHYYEGEGSGRDDTIEAMLSDGEYVMDAETVALLGDGSNKEGARRLDEMRRNLRKHKGKNLTKGRFSHDAKQPDQYLARGGRTRKALRTRKKAKARGGVAIEVDDNELLDLMSKELGVA